MSSVTDRIEKSIVLRAPVARVWHAIADAGEFSRWFGFVLDGPFEVGKRMRGTFTGTLDEAAIMDAQRRLGVPPSGIKPPPPDAVFCTVDAIEPERRFAFRWIPYGIDADADPAHEPTTLVELVLEPVAEGTRLTVTESGFDQVPAHRRARAFRMNEGGWGAQVENLRRHVEGA